MNFNTQEALVGIILGISIILIIGTGIHLIHNVEYANCMTTQVSTMINTTTSMCIKPSWWFGL